MSQPPNGVILAPSARWRASSGEQATGTAAQEPTACDSSTGVVEAPGREFRVELDDGGVDLVLHRAQGQDVQDALTRLEHVDDLLVGAHEHRRLPADDEVHGGDVLVEGVAQIAEHLPDGLELDAGVEQVLDGLELEEIPVGIEASAAAAAGRLQRGADEVGAGPVVELAVGDAHDLGGSGAAVALGDVGCHDARSPEGTRARPPMNSRHGRNSTGVTRSASVESAARGVNDRLLEPHARAWRRGVCGSAEVLGGHLIDELAELLEHGLGIVDGLAGFGHRVAGSCEDGFLNEDRRSGTHCEGDGVRGSARDAPYAVGAVEFEFGEEGLVLEVGDHDTLYLDRERVENRLEQVVGHGPGGLDGVHRQGDGRRLGAADEDRQQASVGAIFLQEHDGCRARELDTHSDQFHLDHGNDASRVGRPML